MSEARTHAPSERHLQAGLRAGLFPRTELIGAAGSACALLATGMVSMEQAGARLRALTRTALAGQLPHPHELLPVLGLALMPVVAAVAFSLMLRRVLVGFAAASAPALRIARPPAQSFAGRALALLGIAALSLLAAAHCLRTPWLELGQVLQAQLVRVAVVLLVCALIEAVFARAAFVRALHLTRHEHQDEQRELVGSALVRAARERSDPG